MSFNLVACTLAILLFPTLVLGADMKVLSWNVYMLPKPIKNSLQKERTEAIPDFLKGSDYDVMFFQEAFIKRFRKAMIQKLGEKYPHYHYLKKASAVYPVFGSGVFVMSRHPFKVLDEVRYGSSCSGADCGAEKGTFLIEITLPDGKSVQFASTHLNAQRKPLVRKAQLAKAHEMFARASRAGVPQIFLGDLNIVAHTEEFTDALELMQMNHLQLSGPIMVTNARVNECYKTPKTKKWIDHVWIDRATSTEGSVMQVVPTEFSYKGKRCPLSDHHAVEAELHFN